MIPTTTYISPDPEEQRLQHEYNYQQLANLSNGRISSWTPTMFGSGTHGTPTYTTQEGMYFIQGIMVDVWFNLVWSGAGGATTNIMLDLPIEVAREYDWYFPTIISAISLSANYIHTAVKVIKDTATAGLYEASNVSGSAIQALTWSITTGSLYGHLRYPIKR